MTSITACLIVLLTLLVARNLARAADSSSAVCERDDDCKNGATCEFAVENGKQTNYCLCPDRYGGLRCEDYCSLECLNGGICEFRVNSNDTDVLFRDDGKTPHANPNFCICEGKFEGKHCEIPYVTCPDWSRCQNGGTCELLSGSSERYGCKCPEGYSGEMCNIVPVEEDPGTSILDELEQETHMSAVALFAVIVGSVGLVLSAVIWYRVTRSQRRQTIAHDLAKRGTTAFSPERVGGTVWFDVESKDEPEKPEQAKNIHLL